MKKSRAEGIQRLRAIFSDIRDRLSVSEAPQPVDQMRKSEHIRQYQASIMQRPVKPIKRRLR